MASSTELSTTSHTRWWRPLRPVEPMYMPGRLRTGSSPSRTVMSLAPYEGVLSATGAAFLRWNVRVDRRGREGVQATKPLVIARNATTRFYQRASFWGADPDGDPGDVAGADGGVDAGFQVGFEPADLGAPGRLVGGDGERAVAQGEGLGMGGHGLAHHGGPALEEVDEG